MKIKELDALDRETFEDQLNSVADEMLFVLKNGSISEIRSLVTSLYSLEDDHYFVSLLEHLFFLDRDAYLNLVRTFGPELLDKRKKILENS